ncbi:GPALPP motifs-containing protein 1 [Microtus ochrogaster]|uniref:GPALPP motifs-containing protein 1 n=1 Tax=Microtus ochrogaster TaxID=79684 RepID=A0A8J6FZZ5_MICOH|nr:GPALPP motifs-containing protein 1 [Microtus ochrogaster]
MARDLIGPALPPGFKVHATAEDEERDPSPVAGPALPPNYRSSSSDSSDSDEDSSSLSEEGNQESEEDDSGPTARKQRRNQDRDDDDDGFFGPALPPGFKRQDDSPPSKWTMLGLNQCIWEAESSEDEDIVGPMPAKGPVNYSVTTEFEKRAQRMKEKLTKGDDDSSKPVTRESWMTELPPEMKDFGLGPRTFKRRADDRSGDRSVWTDTPADRERKAKEIQEARKSFSKKDEENILSGRDKRLAEQVSSYNGPSFTCSQVSILIQEGGCVSNPSHAKSYCAAKAGSMTSSGGVRESKRSESLMDIHHKKLKNKAAEDKNKHQERIPFDRDKDLKVNRFDEAQKKALIKKSRELNTRFSHGKGNMFL